MAKFGKKWTHLLHEEVPKSKAALLASAAQWTKELPEGSDLVATAEALALFELLLMSGAPDIFGEDE